ncbi:hypothetical protein ACFQ7J_07415 [Streptomyces sp. NPDC056501]|uniref:hypothetical protein n=1 Tax=Streptomyces sp. NPDC056501 TaxID=3345841 RepID=UPI0036B4C38B
MRDPALGKSQDIKDSWLEAFMRVFAEATDLEMRHRVLLPAPLLVAEIIDRVVTLWLG